MNSVVRQLAFSLQRSRFDPYSPERRFSRLLNSLTFLWLLWGWQVRGPMPGIGDVHSSIPAAEGETRCFAGAELLYKGALRLAFRTLCGSESKASELGMALKLRGRGTYSGAQPALVQLPPAPSQKATTCTQTSPFRYDFSGKLSCWIKPGVL